MLSRALICAHGKCSNISLCKSNVVSGEKPVCTRVCMYNVLYFQQASALHIGTPMPHIHVYVYMCIRTTR